MKRSFFTTTIGLTLISGVGCSTTDKGYVQREWSSTLRELGIVPVFPPREDVVVGDIYAFSFDPNSAVNQRIFETKWGKLSEAEKVIRQEMGMSPKLARLDLNTEIMNEYNITISAPTTPGDYNSILGNQALASAIEAVNEAEAKKSAFEKQLSDLEKEVTTKTAELLTKKRAKDDADQKVSRAQAALENAQSKTPDVSLAEQRVVTNRAALRNAEDALTAANNKATDATGTPSEAAAKLEQRVAQRSKDAAEKELQRAQEDLAAAKLVKPDLTAEKALLDAAKLQQKTAADDVTIGERAKADADTKLADKRTELAPRISVAADSVAAAKSMRDAIGKAGEKLLYAQPRDARRDVYTVRGLPTANDSDDLANSRINRLRLVGFPEFATASFTQGDLAALIPIESFVLGLNFSHSTVSKVVVKVPAAESYGLSTEKFRDKVIEEKQQNPGKLFLKPNILKALQFQMSGTNSVTKTTSQRFVRLISEVFYARALDVSLFSSSASGARVRTSIIGTEAAAGKTPTPDFSKDPTGGAFPVQSGAIGTASSKNSIEQIQASMNRTVTVPGGAVQLISYNESSVGVRRVFDRPIAIGTRGFILQVLDLTTGEVSVSVDQTVISNLQ